MRLITWIALILGRSVARLALVPICLYFLAFSASARAASGRYLERIAGRRAGAAEIYRHYHVFASTILDRIFLLRGEHARFDVHIHGEEEVLQAAADGKGVFLLGAHLGSFEVLRACAAGRPGVEINMLMYERNAHKVKAALQAINPKAATRIISLGELDSMLKVQAAFARGELVGMLGDRTFGGESAVSCSFLGSTAMLPSGPLRLAGMLERPIFLMVGLYRGKNRYDVHFERLAGPSDFGGLPRQARIEAAVRGYASRLEHYCRMAPYNWFNFYDYWT